MIQMKPWIFQIVLKNFQLFRTQQDIEEFYHFFKNPINKDCYILSCANNYYFPRFDMYILRTNFYEVPDVKH